MMNENELNITNNSNSVFSDLNSNPIDRINPNNNIYQGQTFYESVPQTPSSVSTNSDMTQSFAQNDTSVVNTGNSNVFENPTLYQSVPQTPSSVSANTNMTQPFVQDDTLSVNLDNSNVLESQPLYQSVPQASTPMTSNENIVFAQNEALSSNQQAASQVQINYSEDNTVVENKVVQSNEEIVDDELKSNLKFMLILVIIMVGVIIALPYISGYN